MIKYNFELKIKIVLEKGYSSKYLCKKYNIKQSGTILYWVKLYQTYGLSGIKPMTNHIIYPGELKQKVMHWMHTHDSSYPETALQFKISSLSVIFTWQRRLETKGLSELYTTIGRPKMKNTNLNYKSDLNFDYYLIKYNYEVLK